MNLNLVFVIIIVTFILSKDPSYLSFAKKNDKEEDGKDLKIPVSSIDKTKKINIDSKEPDIQNDILNDRSKSILYMWISLTVNN